MLVTAPFCAFTFWVPVALSFVPFRFFSVWFTVQFSKNCLSSWVIHAVFHFIPIPIHLLCHCHSVSIQVCSLIASPHPILLFSFYCYINVPPSLPSSSNLSLIGSVLLIVFYHLSCSFHSLFLLVCLRKFDNKHFSM